MTFDSSLNSIWLKTKTPTMMTVVTSLEIICLCYQDKASLVLRSGLQSRFCPSFLRESEDWVEQSQTVLWWPSYNSLSFSILTVTSQLSQLLKSNWGNNWRLRLNRKRKEFLRFSMRSHQWSNSWWRTSVWWTQPTLSSCSPRCPYNSYNSNVTL